MPKREEKPMQNIRIDTDTYQLLSRLAAAETRTMPGELYVIVKEYATDQLDMDDLNDEG